jgi:thiamine biosynthesis protein ThiS
MKLHINGNEGEYSPTCGETSLTVASLIAQLGMKADRVAVELNLDIVPRDRWAETSLNDGDKLEVVHFVGGGSAHTASREQP